MMDEGGRSFTRMLANTTRSQDLFLERHGAADVLRVAVVMTLCIGPAEPPAVLSIGLLLADESDEVSVVTASASAHDFVVFDAILVVEIAVGGPLDLAVEFPVFPIDGRDESHRQIKDNHRLDPTQR